MTLTTTVVLTGASGFLGQHVLQRLLEKPNLQIVALCRSPSNEEEELPELLLQHAHHCKVVQVDLTSKESIDNWMQEDVVPQKIDCCIHAAAISNPGVCQQDPESARALNVPKYFIDALFQNNPSLKFVALSTDQVYNGQNGGAPYKEESLGVAPCNVYGLTKLELEQYVLQQHDSVYMLRSSILLGDVPTLWPAHSTFLHFCKSRTAPTTFWTDEIRSVVDVRDVVTVIERLLDNDNSIPFGIYNMGGPQPVSRYDMAVVAVNHPEYAVAAATTAATTTNPSPLNIAMDSTKLLHATGLTFRTLHEIVENMTFE